MNTNFIFNGLPDSESYAEKMKSEMYESETRHKKKKSMKVHKQENVENQFFAFRKVASTKKSGEAIEAKL
jgi:hypothetical protein